MIKKIMVLLIVISFIGAALACENNNNNNGCSNGRCQDGNDHDKGKGNDKEIDNHGHDHRGDDGDDDDGSDDGGSDDNDGSDDGSDTGGSDDDSDSGDSDTSSDVGDSNDDGDNSDGSSSNPGSSSGSGRGILTLSVSQPGNFYGDSFGASDCERVSILTKQLDNETLKARAIYKLQIIADDYDLTIDEFIQYKCSKTGLTFYNPEISSGGRVISDSTGTGDLSQPIPYNKTAVDPIPAKKNVNERLIEQITIGAVILIILMIGFSYLYWRFRKLE